MNTRVYKFLLIFSCVLLPSQNAFSQNNSIGDYVPPPLFGGAPKAQPPPTKLNSNNDVEKKRALPSKVIELRKNENNAPTKQEVNNLKKLKELRALKAARQGKIPLPKIKPIRNAATKNQTQKPSVSSPIKAPPKTVASSQGVVTGPKTMPAVKKKSVEAEVLDGADNSPVQTDMLARVQKKIEPVKAPSIQKEDIKEKVASASLLTDRLVLVFQAGETVLSDNKMAMLLEQVTPAVKDIEKRLNITAYASPDSEALNADKRLALSRGLAVRGYLLKNGVKPSQINVRSLGSDTQQQPYDRVEIVLIQ